MSKLSLDALKQRADAVASEELMGQISGGTDNDCHDSFEETEPTTTTKPPEKTIDNFDPNNWGNNID